MDSKRIEKKILRMVRLVVAEAEVAPVVSGKVFEQI